ncbi:MAG: NADH:flavin oxidoreductase [Aquabacterium sp.]
MAPRLADPLPMPRGPAIGNRIWLAPLTNWQSHADGTLGEDEYHWLMRRAEGGFGLTMTCAAHVHPAGQGFPGQLGAWSDAHLPGLRRLADGIRAAGGVSSLQIQHSGWRADPALTGGRPRVSPWPDEASGCRVMDTGEVEALVEDFIAAAVRGATAGFDGVEVHGAHGYLLAQFQDVDRNQRADRYGGPFDNRVRVLDEILAGIRARTPAGFQIGLRLSPEKGGLAIAESRRYAERVMSEGRVDYLDWSLWNVFKEPADPALAGRPLIDWFTDIPRGPACMGVAGRILDTATAQACLDRGADFVLVGRGAILHADFARLALADLAFQAVARPVSRDWLAAQAVSPPFVHYLATTWKDFVAG